MVDSFLKHLRFEKRISANTILAYQTDLRQFSEFLLDTFGLADISAADHNMVRSWIISRVEAGNEHSSINRKIACLRIFFRFLLQEKKIAADPMMKIAALKKKKKLPVFIREDDMVKLLDNRAFENTFTGYRDRLVLEMFYGTGIRLSELISLKDEGIDVVNRTIKVLGKRNKQRVIPFSNGLVGLINDYLNIRNREVERKNHGIFFVRSNGEPCYPVMIYKMVKKYLAEFPTIEKRSPHILRHSYATHLLNKGADLNAVKDLLGHASLAATQIYTHNSMEKLKKVFDQAHPKA